MGADLDLPRRVLILPGGGEGEGEGDHNKCSTQAETTMESIYFSCTPYTGPRARVVHPERTSSGLLR